MMIRKYAVASRRTLRLSRLLQIGLIFAFWLAGELLVRVFGLPIPGGIAGMLIVLALLSSRRLGLGCMRRGANWFLAEMLLFFIPAVLAVLDHRELLGLLGLKILVVILAGTCIVMTVTALCVDLFYRWGAGSGGGGHAAR